MGVKLLYAKLTDFNSLQVELCFISRSSKFLWATGNPSGDLNINIRSASNFTSVGIYNVVRDINWIDQRSRIKLYKCSSIGTSII